MTETMHPAGDLLLLGGGGHARVVAATARTVGWTIVGCLDSSGPDGAGAPDLPCLGVPADLDRILAGSPAARVHAAVGDSEVRRRLLDAAGDRVAGPIVHAAAVVVASAQLADGVFVGPRAVVNADTRLERGAIVNTGAIVEHDCSIGPFAHVAPGAILAGGVSIGAGSLVGAGATIVPGVTIGRRAVVGAGAVVLADVPDESTVVGVPARPRS
ncbi:MAG: NeuD/PglB/VioB family sugar acetyltransferase [Planctomycetota bacterium]